jgi:hypothetical protein
MIKKILRLKIAQIGETFRTLFTLTSTQMCLPLQGCQMVYFQTKNINLGKLWRALQWTKLVHFIAIWSILWPLGNLIALWKKRYSFSVLVRLPIKIWQPCFPGLRCDVTQKKVGVRDNKSALEATQKSRARQKVAKNDNVWQNSDATIFAAFFASTLLLRNAICKVAMSSSRLIRKTIVQSILQHSSGPAKKLEQLIHVSSDK